jgi:hypothetical protein
MICQWPLEIMISSCDCNYIYIEMVRNIAGQKVSSHAASEGIRGEGGLGSQFLGL